MTNVAAYRESDWKKDDGTTVKVTHVTLDDGREIPGYDLPPGIEANKPLPEGWEIATSKSGKPYIKVPKPGKGGFGGATAFRNTREGQAIEQERMDRRTALMQAVAAQGGEQVKRDIDMAVVMADANQMYAWLRQTAAPGNPVAAGAGGPLRSDSPAPSPSAGSPGEGPQQGKGKADWGQEPVGKQENVPLPVGCAHEVTTPLKPDGSALPAGKVRCVECNTVLKEG